MAKKITWIWTIIKTSNKQSGYLLTCGTEGLDENDPQVAVALDDLTGWTTAWTTLGAAKRHAAACMDRSRVKWTEGASDTNVGEGTHTWEARIEAPRVGKIDQPDQ